VNEREVKLKLGVTKAGSVEGSKLLSIMYPHAGTYVGTIWMLQNKAESSTV